MAAGAFLTLSPAQAEDAADIAYRIESTFDLVLRTPVEPAEPATREALERRAMERRGDATMLLSYAPTTPESTAFQSGAPIGPATGVLGLSPAGGEIVLARLPRPRPDQPIITGSIAPSEQAAPDRSATEANYFARFAGSFSGSGEVKRNAQANANQVECTLTGQPSTTGVSISGKCGASIFSRDVRADIRYDPASGVYTGSYVGSSIGPAKLRGTRRGDAVVMTITWPKPVNGDVKATMTIRNSGNGKLAIVVTDAVRPGGPEAEVTRLALNQL